jgi:hypothetical protein
MVVGCLSTLDFCLTLNLELGTLNTSPLILQLLVYLLETINAGEKRIDNIGIEL